MRDFNVIGVMSGTSLDGVDLVYVNFNYHNKWNFNIIRAKTYKYEDRWIEGCNTCEDDNHLYMKGVENG